MITMKPGCFGSAVAYSTEAAVCASCGYSNQCSDVAYEKVVNLQVRKVEVSALLAEHRRFRAAKNKSLDTYHLQDGPELDVATMARRPRANFQLSIEQQEAIKSVPVVKAHIEIERILKRGGDPLRDMRAGIQPEKPAFLSIACRLLMSGESVDSKRLADEYEKEGMARSSARSLAAIAIAVLIFFGVPRNEDTLKL